MNTTLILNVDFSYLVWDPIRDILTNFRNCICIISTGFSFHQCRRRKAM